MKGILRNISRNPGYTKSYSRNVSRQLELFFKFMLMARIVFFGVQFCTQLELYGLWNCKSYLHQLDCQIYKCRDLSLFYCILSALSMVHNMLQTLHNTSFSGLDSL